MGNRAMKKDASYYEDRLWDKWNARVDALPNGLSDDEFSIQYAALEEDNAVTMITRIGLHFNEARAIIQQLLDDPDPSDPNSIYLVVWADRVPGIIDRDTAPPQLRTTRQGLIERLHWISSEEFGEDLDEWRSWLAAFEANTPLPYSR